MLSGVLSLGQTVTSVLFWHFLATRPPRVVVEVHAIQRPSEKAQENIDGTLYIERAPCASLGVSRRVSFSAMVIVIAVRGIGPST